MKATKHNRPLVLAGSMLLAIGVAAWPSDARADKPAQPGAPAAQANGKKPDVMPETAKSEVKTEPGKPSTDTKLDAPKGKEGEAKEGAAKAKAADPAEREARREKEREALRSSIHGPMTEAMREELRRHARRLARIERIRALAVEAKDKDATERADKLLAKENARHEKWMSNPNAGGPASAQATPPAGDKANPANPTAATNAKAAEKGGAR